MYHWNIFLAALAFGGAVNIVQGEKSLTLASGFILNYNVNHETGVINFIAVVKTTGWFGIGYNDAPIMAGADMAIVTIEDGTGKPRIVDYHGEAGAGEHEIIKDVHQDLTTIENESFTNATHIHVHFQRKLVTDDPNQGQDKDITNAEKFIIWAFGLNKIPIFHSGNKGSVKVNLLEGEHEHVTSTTSKPNVRTNTAGPSPSHPKESSAGTIRCIWNSIIVSVFFSVTLFHSRFLA